jgi:hypothetical protein
VVVGVAAAAVEILEGKDLNITELHNLTYAVEAVITGEINETGRYKSESQSPETSSWVKQLQKSINGIRK